MNFTLGNTLPTIGRRINWQIVTLPGGIAMAISLMAVLAIMEEDTAQTPPASFSNVSDQTMTSPTSHTSTRPQVIIVGSQAQADALETEMSADQMAAVSQGFEVPHLQTSLVVIDSPDKQYLYDQITADQMAADVFDIVDLRASTTAFGTPESAPQSTNVRPTVYVVQSPEQAAALTLAMETDAILVALDGFNPPVRDISFLIVSTPHEEQALEVTLQEQLLLSEPEVHSHASLRPRATISPRS